MSSGVNLIPELEDDRYEEYEDAGNFHRKNSGWKEEKGRSYRKFQDGAGGDRRTYFRDKLTRRSKVKFTKRER